MFAFVLPTDRQFTVAEDCALVITSHAAVSSPSYWLASLVPSTSIANSANWIGLLSCVHFTGCTLLYSDDHCGGGLVSAAQLELLIWLSTLFSKIHPQEGQSPEKHCSRSLPFTLIWFAVDRSADRPISRWNAPYTIAFTSCLFAVNSISIICLCVFHLVTDSIFLSFIGSFIVGVQTCFTLRFNYTRLHCFVINFIHS